ncbi:MAG: maleylpyruvate isomerase N-terminal domain-containing protein [Anaerolineales bacterium]|nr:maleylpyruvate isomerase N-terminal domain-containing protein [Anaerolineales bacterium]
MNRDFQTANNASREKMRKLIEGMSDEELALPAVAGWTVAATLAHVAFWDFRDPVSVESLAGKRDRPFAL